MTLTKEHTIISLFERNGVAEYTYLNQIFFFNVIFSGFKNFRMKGFSLAENSILPQNYLDDSVS